MFITATRGISQPLEESSHWSSDFRDFITKCLSKDPKKRPSADELLQVLPSLLFFLLIQKHSFLLQAANTRKGMRKILTEVFLQRAIGIM
jgi:serine/threonine protein kinase